MVRSFIGQIGHLSVIISFVTALVAAIAYFIATQNEDKNQLEENSWKNFARNVFYIHGVAVLGIIVVLFTIIYKNYFEYHYAWEHASKSLPAYYMISCFWEGQEGSFLLWIFWDVLLGLIMIKTAKAWEGPAMTIFALVQFFLTSMILGVVLGDLKVGSSPFMLLKEFMPDAPIFKIKPDYIPEDGTGLNPLLQNYWMVIHPPTLFLGFATTLVPFSFVIAGLWRGRYKEWVRPALPWSLFAAFVLGLGILMGAYWAYETLNFGGYWNWDPVENAVYVPWLILVAAIHTMLIYKNNGTALKASVILVVLTFLLILYSTFLTRSGILGNASVHSFTDLGLSGQLLIYLLAFVFIAIALLVYKWKNIPGDKEEESLYSREFWVFIGVLLLFLAGFQVLATTSIPVYNKIVELFHVKSNIAPPSDQGLFYSKWQLYFMVPISLLTGLAQFFYWKKMEKEKLQEVLYSPFIITLIITTAIVVFTKAGDIWYIILILTSVFTIVSNAIILLDLRKTNIKLAGGSVAHIGLGLILIGIIYSSGYSKIVSLNTKGLVYSKEFSESMNKENLLLFRNSPEKMGADSLILTYKGPRIEVEGYSGYLKKSDVISSGAGLDKVIAKIDIKQGEKVIFKKGDTLKTSHENTYYEVEYQNAEGKTYSLFPRTQVNQQMGFMASPDIKHYFLSDLYTHVSSVPDAEKGKTWSPAEEFAVTVGDTFFMNDYVAIFEKAEQVTETPYEKLEKGDIAIKAKIRILDGQKAGYVVEPLFLVRSSMYIKLIPEEVDDLGIKVGIKKIVPEKNQFIFEVQKTQKDWIILKAVEKPYVNLLWLGSLLVLIGTLMALNRRYLEFKKMRDKDMVY